MTTTMTMESSHVSDIDSRFTGRQMRGTKPLWVKSALHAAAKHESVIRDTTLGEIAHLAMCQYLHLDPETMQPIGIKAAG